MKKQLLLFITLLLTTMVSYSQSTNWSIGPAGSVDYAYRTTVSGSGTPFNGKEKAKLGYSGGLQAVLQLTDHVNLEPGVFYTNMGFQLEKTATNPISPGGPNTPDFHSEDYSYEFIQLPIKITYHGNGKFRFIWTLGVSANILLKQTITEYDYYTYNDPDHTTKNSHTYPSNNTSLYIFTMAGAGVEYNKKRYTFRVQPMFTYGVMPIELYSNYKDLWTVGAQFGIFYQL